MESSAQPRIRGHRGEERHVAVAVHRDGVFDAVRWLCRGWAGERGLGDDVGKSVVDPSFLVERDQEIAFVVVTADKCWLHPQQVNISSPRRRPRYSPVLQTFQPTPALHAPRA